MPRYMVERSFPAGLEIPTTTDGLKACLGVVENNATEQVTWVHSYVTDDHQKTFCVYDGPSPESIRRAASLSELPIDSISEISVLDPYFYVSAGAG
jgi:hypothetical protein